MKIIYILCCISIIMLPTGIAGLRGHRNFTAIFLLNLLFGWTGLGWIISFIWSLTN